MHDNPINPSVFALRFLRWFCPSHLLEGIEGDLLETFEFDVKEHGAQRAKLLFWLHVFMFFRPGILLRNRFSIQLINTMMLGNYFKVASRNIGKRKFYSFINAFGLSIGISFCILIYLFIVDEKSFDQFHVNKDHIFRIDEKSFDTWQHADPEKPYRKSAWIQKALQPVLKEEVPEVKYATRIIGQTGVVRYQDKVFKESITYVDPDFFQMFSFPLVQGSRSGLLMNMTDVVINQRIAKKFFGETDPLGKTISIDNEGEKIFTILAVIENAPVNSSLDYSILIRQEHRPYYDPKNLNWRSFDTPTFVQIFPNASVESLKTNLSSLIKKHMGEYLETWRKESAIPVPADAKMLEYELTSLNDLHLKNEVPWHKVSDPQYSWILGGIALLILLIACINYISLSLTSSVGRSTEVGVRKAVGAQQHQLIYQFGFESIMIACFSMIIGLGLVGVFLPAFNEFTDKGISLSVNQWFTVFGIGLLLAVLVGVLAGCYPSLFLSRYKPVAVLKGKFGSKVKADFTRPLVVFQFSLSAFLIISSLIMFKQMQFVTTKELGYNKDQVLVVSTQSGWNESANQMVKKFRDRSIQESSIVSVAGTSGSFNKETMRYGYKIKGETKAAYVYAVDPLYIPTLGIELVAGRNFDMAIASDSNAVIVNESLVRDMKWTNPLDEYLNWREDSVGLGAKVIGVVKDYHFLSLEEGFEPMFLSMDKKNAGYLTTILVRVAGTDLNAGLEKVKLVWKEINPDLPFDYSFLDEDVANQYQSYKRWMRIMTLATGFAIVISCLGLFGLAGINAINRTKEIGIRKVMGANLPSIFILLNKQYLLLSLLAYIIAIPFSWYLMNKWLSSFHFRITIQWELFAIATAAGLMVAMLTVTYHAMKAAHMNPAETLKEE